MRKRTAIAVLCLYAAIVAWLTWPLASNLTTHLPKTEEVCYVDELLLSWALAHQSRALTSDPRQLPHGNIYHPTRYSLFYGEAAFGALPYFLPTFLLTRNPALALNLTFLGSVTLTAWVLHLVVLHVTGSALAGFLAAWTLLMTRWILWTWCPCAPNYAVLQYFPLIIALALRPARRFVSALWTLPLLVLQALTTVYVAVACFVPLGLIATARLLRKRTRQAGLRLLAVMGLAALFVLPAYAGYLAVRAENPLFSQQTAWFFAAHSMLVLPWGPLSRFVPTAVPIGALALLAAGGVSFALGPRRCERTRRAWKHAAFWSFVGAVMTITPTVIWHDKPVTLPHAVIDEWLPVYDVVRAPQRLGVAALMGLSMLAGLAFAECARRLRALGRTRVPLPLATAGLALLAAGAMYAEYAFAIGAAPTLVGTSRTLFELAPGTARAWSLPVEPLPTAYPLLRTIAGDSPLERILKLHRGPLLELPVPGPLGTAPHARAVYRSIFHGRPLLNGYSGYWPVGFRERMKLARRLPDGAALSELRRETGVQTLLVHANEMRRAQRKTWLALAESGGNEDIALLARDGDDLVFRVGVEPD